MNQYMEVYLKTSRYDPKVSIDDLDSYFKNLNTMIDYCMSMEIKYQN
jgi:hypothetical protein